MEASNTRIVTTYKNICPAPPGWTAVFDAHRSVPVTIPVACWALRLDNQVVGLVPDGAKLVEAPEVSVGTFLCYGSPGPGL